MANKKSTGVALAVAWPLAKKAATQLSVFVANNPDIQKRLAGLGAKVSDVQRARTPEAKIARAMTSVREQADLVLASEPSDSVAALQASGWKQRADQVERALQILQHQPRAMQKSQRPRIAAMADSLVAEVLTSLIDDDAAD
ncbi:hypothetical protein [Cellulomonas sp. ICMP 17802]|uniref:hypothetical protein n=1 Tax=Cellulomonas sp. ICMP 17802 TaxID=3239199 RepID=UPI00351BC49D